MSVYPKELVDRFMRTPEQRLDRMLSAFEAAQDTDASTPGRNLRALLDASPELKDRYLESIAQGALDGFEPLPRDANASGEYSPTARTIRLPLEKLDAIGSDVHLTDTLVFTMGHEIEHALFQATEEKALATFRTRVADIADSAGPHDYTAALDALLDVYRENESRAHLGGFNAMATHVRARDPDAGLAEFYQAHPYRMDQFIDRSGLAPDFSYAMKPGLTLDANGMLQATPDNIEAAGRHYYDRPASVVGLGADGNQDYVNYYAGYPLSVIAAAEAAALQRARSLDSAAAAPEVRLDMAALRLRPSLLSTDLSITDTGRSEIAPGSPTQDHAAASRINAPAAALAGDNVLYAQALRSIDGLAGQLGLADRGEAANLAAATAAQAMQAGMDRIDGVLVGVSGRLYAYQGDPASASVHRAAVDVDQAKQTPARDSLDAMTAATPRPEPQPPSQQLGMRL